MLEFDNLSDLTKLAGKDIGTGGWRRISQGDINDFAKVTGDQQWIHTDPERTRRELDMPAIAHGYLILSLLPCFMAEIFTVASVKRMINYGSNYVRFLTPVPAGSRVRGHVALKEATLESGRLRAIFTVNVEIEGHDKPALHAEVITLMFE